MVKFFRFDIYELINHYKVTFFSARTSQNFCHFHRHVNHVRFSSTCVRERPEKYFLVSAWRTELYGPGPRFFVIWYTWIYTHGIFQSVILVSIFILRVYVTFSLFFKIWLTESILIFREWLFRETYFLLASNTIRHKIFSDENKQPSLKWCRTDLQGEIMEESCRWVLNIKISILLKKRWFTYMKGSLKGDEYHIYMALLPLQSL